MSSAPLMPIQTWKSRLLGGPEDVHLVLDDDPGVDAVGQDARRRCPARPCRRGRSRTVPARCSAGPDRDRSEGCSSCCPPTVPPPAIEVAVGVDADAGVRRRRRTRTAGTSKLMISSSPTGIGRDPERVQREIAGRTSPGATVGIPGWAPASVTSCSCAWWALTIVAPSALDDLQVASDVYVSRSAVCSSKLLLVVDLTDGLVPSQLGGVGQHSWIRFTIPGCG